MADFDCADNHDPFAKPVESGFQLIDQCDCSVAEYLTTLNCLFPFLLSNLTLIVQILMWKLLVQLPCELELLIVVRDGSTTQRLQCLRLLRLFDRGTKYLFISTLILFYLAFFFLEFLGQRFLTGSVFFGCLSDFQMFRWTVLIIATAKTVVNEATSNHLKSNRTCEQIIQDFDIYANKHLQLHLSWLNPLHYILHRVLYPVAHPLNCLLIFCAGPDFDNQEWLDSHDQLESETEYETDDEFELSRKWG